MNALADARVANYLNENFYCTYLKVGAFRIIGGQKVGGNVASYFCLEDGAVIHAVAGPKDANQFLTEARWAIDIRKAAQAFSTELPAGDVNWRKYAGVIQKAHIERYHTEHRSLFGDKKSIPANMPAAASREARTHWLLAKEPLARLNTVYPTVWRTILNEELSALPVERR